LVALLMASATADAQTIPNPSNPVLFPAVQFGAPARWTGGIGVLLPYGDNRSAQRGQGLMVEASAGQSGARVSAGPFWFEEYLGLDGRIVLQRTWGHALRAATGSTYLGAEGGVSIAYLRLSAGVAWRVAGPTGRHGTIFLWGAGLQFPRRTRP
jgi:hypothetical protein